MMVEKELYFLKTVGAVAIILIYGMGRNIMEMVSLSIGENMDLVFLIIF